MRTLLLQVGQRLLIGLALWYLMLLLMGKPASAAVGEVANLNSASATALCQA
jgi:hypothetical protein